MRRIITGATGLIGKRLAEHWLSENHTIVAIGRNKQRILDVFGTRVEALTWAELSPDALRFADVIVNLAGANIAAQRWTTSRKEEVLSSRIDTTQQIAILLKTLGDEAPPLFNASAIGIYGLQAQIANGLPPPLTEDVAIDWANPPDFLSQIGRRWEQASKPAMGSGRVVFMRFGVVLAKEGGALPKLIQPFKFFMGGPIGTGNQPFSWIALDDLIRGIDFLLSKTEANGPFNFVAPTCVTQRELANTVGKVMHKPAIMPMPSFAMKLLLGDEMARELLLEGQHVYPKRLLELGFQFKYPTIETALQSLLQ